jgi:HAD superfamily hydrolase (TIGR01509 family)
VSVKGVVFDCDGTLVDSERLSFQAWREVLAGHGYELRDDDIEATRGRSYPHVHAYFAERASIPDADAFWPLHSGRLYELLETDLEVFADAVEAARDLKERGVPIAIATGSRRERLDATLRAAGLHELFDVTVAQDEVPQAKPAPDLFLRAAELLGVTPAECVAVEDSPTGVEAALAAGMRVVAVARAPEHRPGLRGGVVVDRLTAAVIEAGALTVAWEEPGATAIVVPVPEADPLTGSLRRRYTSSGSEGVPAHVTLLAPFAPAARLERILPSLDALVSSWAPAPFALRRVRRWPSIVWLDPEPSTPFVAMTKAVVARFPGHPPYGGEHDEVIPHVTVATCEDERVLEKVAAAAEPALPIACAGDMVQLLERGDDLRWHERQSWRLVAQ